MSAKYHLEMEHGTCVTWKYNNDTFIPQGETDQFGFLLRSPSDHRNVDFDHLKQFQ